MAPILRTYAVVIGPTTYFFRGHPTSYAGISTTVGITEAATAQLDDPLTPVSELLKSPDITRLHIYYKVTVGNVIKKRKATILCMTNLAQGALNSNPTTYKGDATARFAKPRRATFY